MKAEININDSELDKFIKNSIDAKFNELDLDKIIESKINLRMNEMLKGKLSNEKIDNFAKDRISRIITTESLKDITKNVTGSDVLANLESKLLLIIKNSKDFKILVKSVLKDSL